MKASLGMVVVGLGLLAPAMSTQAAALLVYDTFTGTAGTALTAHTPDIGTGGWTVDWTVQAVLNGSGGVGMGTGGGSQAATPFTLDKSATTGIQTSFLLGAANYVAIGFGEMADSYWFGNANHVWTQIDANGVLAIKLGGWNGGNEGWTGGTVAGFDRNVVHTLQLDLNFNAREAYAYVDGALVAGGGYGFANGVFHTSDKTIDAAQYRLDAGSNIPGAYIDYMAVGVTPIAIPEPASLGLLATAGLMLTRRRK